LINLDKETRNININNFNKEGYYITNLIKLLKNNCNTETDISGWDIINTNYDITLNENKILGLKFYWSQPDFGYRNEQTYNFDLNTGKEIIVEDIFNEETINLLDDLSSFLLTDINNQLNYILKNDSFSEELKTEYKEQFNEYINENRYKFSKIPKCYITKKEDVLGVEFHLRYEMMKGYNYGNYSSLFLSFKELKPYLTKEFISFIN